MLPAHAEGPCSSWYKLASIYTMGSPVVRQKRPDLPPRMRQTGYYTAMTAEVAFRLRLLECDLVANEMVLDPAFWPLSRRLLHCHSSDVENIHCLDPGDPPRTLQDRFCMCALNP